MSETESINPSKEYGSDNKNNNNSKIIKTQMWFKIITMVFRLKLLTRWKIKIKINNLRKISNRIQMIIKTTYLGIV